MLGWRTFLPGNIKQILHTYTQSQCSKIRSVWEAKHVVSSLSRVPDAHWLVKVMNVLIVKKSGKM